MKKFEQRYTHFLCSNSFVAILLIVSVLIAYLNPAAIASSPSSSLAVPLNIAALILVLLGMLYLNRRYLLLHSHIKLYLALTTLILAAVPSAILSASFAGSLLALFIFWAMAVMYSSYKQKRVSRRIFLVFTIASALSVIHFGVVAYLPLLYLICIQMRCFSLRNLFASLIGLITPLWIIFGLYPSSISHVAWPQLTWPQLSHLLSFSLPQIISISLTLFTAVVLTLANIVKVFYGFNARTRAFNGVLALTTLWTAAATMLDFDNAPSYLLLLSALVAMQLTLHFALSMRRRAYIPLTLVILIYLSMDIWNLIITQTS